MRVTTLKNYYGSEMSRKISLVGSTPKWGSNQTDMEIRKLERSTVKPTPYNRRWCIYNDTTAYSFSCMTGAILAGRGLAVKCERESDQEKVDAFNARINFNRDSIEDLVGYLWIDNVIDGVSFWRPWKTRQLDGGVDLSRVDPSTMDHVVHPTKGYSMYIQTGKRYMEDVKDGTLASFTRDIARKKRRPGYKRVNVFIPDTIDKIVKFKLFDYPPASSIVQLIVYKKWILWYMRKHSQKYWSPFTLAKMGSDKYIPLEGEYAYYKQILDAELPKMYNFSGITLPGWIDLEQLQSTSAQSSAIYTNALDWLNKEIMNSLHGSMQQREASGKSGRSAAEETSRMWIADMESKRMQVDRTLRDLYAHVVTDNGDPGAFKIHWPVITPSTVVDLAVAAERAATLGVLSTTEIRQALHLAYDFLDYTATPEPADTLEERKFKQAKKMAEKMAKQPAMDEKKPPGKNKALGTQTGASAGGGPTKVRTGTTR